jgi:hypothetical protein
VDLSLSIVILFLLSAITVRALLFAHDLAELNWLRRQKKADDPSEVPPSK